MAAEKRDKVRLLGCLCLHTSARETKHNGAEWNKQNKTRNRNERQRLRLPHGGGTARQGTPCMHAMQVCPRNETERTRKTKQNQTEQTSSVYFCVLYQHCARVLVLCFVCVLHAIVLRLWMCWGVCVLTCFPLPSPLYPRPPHAREQKKMKTKKQKSKPFLCCCSKLIHDWKRAVQRSLGWHIEEGQSPNSAQDHHGAGDGKAAPAGVPGRFCTTYASRGRESAASSKEASSLMSGWCPATGGRWWLGMVATVAITVAVTVAVTVPAVAAAAKQDGGDRPWSRGNRTAI